MTQASDLVHKALDPDDNIGSGIFAELEAQEKAQERALEIQTRIKAGFVECMATLIQGRDCVASGTHGD